MFEMLGEVLVEQIILLEVNFKLNVVILM